MSAAHTPGPWTCDVMTREVSVTAPCGRVLWVHGTEVDDSVVPDARLIAAAPELLEALLAVLDELGALTNQSELYGRLGPDAERVFDAIDKATGSQS